MKTTPQTAKVLAGALKTHGWQQADLANRSKIAAQTLSLHLNGSRPINDDHLALYITALDKSEQSRLVSAWLQDTLPAEVIANVLDITTNSVREEVRAWRPGLSPEQMDMLDFWAAKFTEDDELARIFRSITIKGGWQPDPSTHGTTLDHAEKVVFDIGKRLGQPPHTTPHPATDQPRSL
jgi:transcriptional regulator with XRE-family HTH domain